MPRFFRRTAVTVAVTAGIALSGAPVLIGSTSLTAAAASNRPTLNVPVSARSPKPTARPSVNAPTPAPTTPAARTSAPTRVLLWKDTFDGPTGAPPDSRYWGYQINGPTAANKQLQRYTTSTDNAALDGKGHLAITARPDTSGASCWYGSCRYTSARLFTANKATVRYGRVEARMKLPVGKGVWPAFWMMGANYKTVKSPDCGEIDIVELIGDKPQRVWGTVHGPGFTGVGKKFDLAGSKTFADDFHTFAVDWTPTSVTFSVDGTAYHQVTPKDIKDGRWVFDQPFIMVLNLAVGGRWPGDPSPTTPIPATLLVDEVAVYR